MPKKRFLSCLVLGITGCLAILAMFYVPVSSANSNNTAVVTSDINSLETGLRRLKEPVEAGRTQAAQAEIARLKEKWLGLKAGLILRGLDRSPSAIAFEQALDKMETAITQDKTRIASALKSLNTSLSQVKSDLQATRVLDPRRLSLTVGGLLVLWAGLVMAIPAFVQRLSLKH